MSSITIIVTIFILCDLCSKVSSGMGLLHPNFLRDKHHYNIPTKKRKICGGEGLGFAGDPKYFIILLMIYNIYQGILLQKEGLKRSKKGQRGSAGGQKRSQ